MEIKGTDKVYSGKDIQDYLAGRMTTTEMHLFEKAALDDPFLTEAIEGYQQMKGENMEGHLNDMHDRFANKDKAARVLPLYKFSFKWWKTAAAIFILCIASGILFLIVRNKPSGTSEKLIAQKQPAGNTEETKTNPYDSSLSQPNRTVFPDVKKQIRTTTQTNISDPGNDIAGNNIVIKHDTAFTYVPPKSSAASAKTNAGALSTEKQKELSVNINNNPPNAFAKNNAVNNNTAPVSNASTSQRIDKTDNIVRDTDKKESKSTHSFIAQVVGPDNSPLPFANISIQNENFGTYADVNGNFRLVSPDTLLSVQVKSVGYIPRTYTLNTNNRQNKIVLAEETIAVTEKTAIQSKKRAPGNTARHAVIVMDTLSNIAPADGWDNYDTYVSNNIMIPDEVIKNNLHGEVELSFEVKKNGSLSNIRVNKSLCESCDEAARRLLEQGPQWKLKSGKKGRTKVSVQF